MLLSAQRCARSFRSPVGPQRPSRARYPDNTHYIALISGIRNIPFRKWHDDHMRRPIYVRSNRRSSGKTRHSFHSQSPSAHGPRGANGWRRPDPPTDEWAYAHIAICERAAAGASTFSSKHGAPRSQDSAPSAACRQADASSRGEEQRSDPGVAGRFACPGLLRRLLVAMTTYGLKH